MAQLRAKQIKLANAGDLLIGGTGGNGAVLPQGADKTVLKVVNGGLAYAMQAATDVTFADASFTATDVSTALVEAKALAKKAGDDLAAEVTRATNAETALGGRVDDVEADLAQEVIDRTDADTALGGRIDTEISDRQSADSALDQRIDALEAAVGEADTATIQAEIDAIETAVGLANDGTFDNSGYAGSTHAGVAATEANTVKSKILAVDAALAAEELARAAAIAQEVTDRDEAIDAAIAQEVADRNAAILVETNRATTEEADIRSDFAAADTLLQTAINGEIARATAEEADIRADFGAADVFIQAELDATQAGAGLAITGAYEAFTDSNYINGATTLKAADKLLDGAIKQIADDLAALAGGEGGSSIASLQEEIDLVEEGLGFTATGAKPDFTSVNYVAATDTLVTAVNKLDGAVKANADDIIAANDRIDALGAAFNYVGVLGSGDFAAFAGGADLENATDLSGLAAGQKDAGDYYKVAADGFFKIGEGAAFFVKQNDGLVWNTAGGVDIIDNTNANVLAGANIAVTGTADTGFTVALDGVVPVANGGTGKAALESVTAGSDKIILGAGAVGSVVNAFTVDVDSTKILFKDLSGVNAPGVTQEGKFLKWTSTGLAYVSAAEVGSTVRAEEDFAPATAANASATLAHVPSGDIQVFINGVKLKKAGFALAGQTVTLNDAANGYGIESGDTLSVSYSYAA